MQAEEHQNFYPHKAFLHVNSHGPRKVGESSVGSPIFSEHTRPCSIVKSLVSKRLALSVNFLPALRPQAFCGVNFLVLTKVGATDTHFPIFTAYIRLCSTMNSLMCLNVGTLAKEFSTFITLIRLSSVAFSGTQQVSLYG